MKEDIVLTITTKGHGIPPDLKNSPDCYTGYFENCHGEQMVFQYNKKTKIRKVWSGERWNNGYDILVIGSLDGSLDNSTLVGVNAKDGIGFSEEEREWIQLVSRTAKLMERPIKEK